MLLQQNGDPYMVNLILAQLPAKGKIALFKRLALDAAPLANIEARKILSALKNREKSVCTGIGHGVALPHARFPTLERPISIFARLTSPAEYGAVDGRRVDLVYLLLGPPIADDAYLRVFSSAMQMLRDPDARQALRHASGQGEIETILPRYFL